MLYQTLKFEGCVARFPLLWELFILQSASVRLDKPPESVEAFVDHLSFLGRMVHDLIALEKEFAIVNKLFTIAKDYNVAIEPEDLALYQTLGPSFQHLKVSYDGIL